MTAAIYTAVAYLAGHWLERASGTIDWILAGAAVAAIAAAWLLVRRQVGRLAERAEQAYPDAEDRECPVLSCNDAPRGRRSTREPAASCPRSRVPPT